VLLWLADRELLRLSDAPEIPFPNISPDFPVSYVLDGLQRLSSLYGVFHFGDRTTNIKFDVHFDLDARTFLRGSDRRLGQTTVPLSALFNPRRLLDEQKRIIDAGLPETVLSEVTELQARFQEYMIPLVTLAERDLDEVVIIFERVNSTGTKLSRVDFMRAITWSENFDLNSSLDYIRRNIEGHGFDITDDTMIKTLGLMFDLDPLPDVLLNLRQRSARELDSATERCVEVLHRVFAFLRQGLGVYSSDFIPYEGQLLTLFRVFLEREYLSGAQAAAIRAWFFWVSFEEVLQGRPDNFVARMIRAVQGQIDSGSIDVPPTIIDHGRFIRRRMLKGKALTTAFVTMLALQHPRGLHDGQEIDIAELTGSYNTSHLLPILGIEELSQVRTNVQSSKVPANILLTNSFDRSFSAGDAKSMVLELAQTSAGREALRRQLIEDTELTALANGDFNSFLRGRAMKIADMATSMVNA
jgi:hypothetical protein